MHERRRNQYVYFLLLIAQPLLAATWSLKHLLPISPLQLIGALMAPFFVYTLSSRSLRGTRRTQSLRGTQSTQSLRGPKDQKELWTQRARRRETLISLLFTPHYSLYILLALCVLLSAILGLITSLGAWEMHVQHLLRTVLFIALPLFGVFYLSDREVLERVALYLLLAVIVPLGMLYYEILVGPINTSERSFSVRYIGLYAQVSVYGIHFALGVLGALYLAVKRGGTLYPTLLLVLLALLAFALPYVLHLSTYAILFALAVVALYVFLRSGKWWHAAALPVIAVALFAFSYTHSALGPMDAAYLPDVEVLKGERPVESIANARGFIWRDHLATWQRLPLQAQLFGYGFAGTGSFSSALGFGAHSDVLRILVTAGIIGLLCYAACILLLLRRIPALAIPERVLLIGALVIWLGYSVALTPSYIMPLMVVVLPIFGALSVGKVKSW